jgi:hypothetical protein
MEVDSKGKKDMLDILTRYLLSIALLYLNLCPAMDYPSNSVTEAHGCLLFEESKFVFSTTPQARS